MLGLVSFVSTSPVHVDVKSQALASPATIAKKQTTRISQAMSSPNPALVKLLGRMFVGIGLLALLAGSYVGLTAWMGNGDADKARQAMSTGFAYLGGVLALAGAIGCGIGWFVLKSLDKQVR